MVVVVNHAGSIMEILVNKHGKAVCNYYSPLVSWLLLVVGQLLVLLVVNGQ